MLFRRVLSTQLKRLKSSAVSANTVLDYQDIPSPKGLPLVGTTLDLIAEGSTQQLHRYIDKRHKQLGPIFREKLGVLESVFVADPEVMRDVFDQEGKYPSHLVPDAWLKYNEMYGCPRGIFFMDGPDWWHYRRILNTLLLKGDTRWIYDACEIVNENFVREIEKTGSECYEDLKGRLYKWSADIIVSVLLGAETYKKHHRDLDTEVTNLAKIVHLIFQTTADLSVIPVSLASKLKIPRWNRFVDAVHNALRDANSLVTTLKTLNAQDGLLPKLMNEKIEFEMIKRIIVDLILAAGDTTAVSFEWMLYLTAKHPHVQEKLRVNPTMAKFVMREGARMYPTATFLTRILPADGVVAGYGVPKGTPVLLSLYTTGRDERYFPDADSFKPERWDRRESMYDIKMQRASLPFAMGLRSCVGKRIAEIQLQTTLLKFVKNFDIELCNKNNIDIVMKMVVHPSEPLLLKFKKL
ncbi:cytochrome P450 315a1, mitochondrial [Zophobas morio]|uniref:cytochrome P450 315a1, mitochondrial n=1 Tax=Zophobas morio TaxID=2755281 RepID=UPI003083B314